MKFYLDSTTKKWVIGIHSGVPAGSCTEYTNPDNGKIRIQTLQGKVMSDENGKYDFLPTEFQNAAGDNYADLAAYQAATKDFFVKAISTGADMTLKGTTNAEKIVLSVPVYADVNFAVASAKVPGSNAPTWAAFTANTNAYTFAVNDYADMGTIEIPHNYKEGTDIELHIHLANNGVNTTDRGVKYQVFFTYGIPNSGTHQFVSENNLSAELTIPANTLDKSAFYLRIGFITGTSFKIGTQLKTRLKRISATGTAPTADPFVGQLGVHYQIDSIGSTTMSAK